MKKILICLLAAVLAFGSFSYAMEEEEMGYDTYYATVKEVVEDEKFSQILVKNDVEEGKGIEEIYLYINSVPIMDLNTGEFVKDYKFTKEEKIQFFFKKNTPVLQSLPPQMTPDFIGINLENGKYSLDVDYFDGEGQGISNRLKINVSKDSVAVNMKDEKVKKFLNNDLAVLYTVSTRSLPPITNPDKIIVLDSKTKVVDLENFKAPGKETYYLRKYYEALGAEIEWVRETKSVRISVKDKFIDISTKLGLYVIEEDIVNDLSNFSLEDGNCLISEKDINDINNYLFK